MDRWLSQAIRLTALLLVVALLGLGGYWYTQRYTHANVPVVDRDLNTIEDQVRQQPQDLGLRVAAANLYIEKGRYGDAIVQAEQVLKVNPEHLGALLAMGQAHARKGDLDSASGYLQRAIELNRDNPMARGSLQLALVHQQLAAIHLEQGRTEDAVEESRQALAIDRGNADSLLLLGNALRAQGHLDEAVQSYRQALRLVPDFAEAYGGLLLAYQEQGDGNRAAFAQGMLRFTSGAYPEAIDSLRQAVSALPKMAEVHLGLAMAYEKSGQKDQSLEEYRIVTELDGGSVAGRQGLTRLSGKADSTP